MALPIFIDMDGTLAEWQWEGKYTEKGYYANLPEIPNMVKATKQLIKDGFDVYILSAVLDDDHSADDKNYWLDKHLGKNLMPDNKRIFVSYGRCKADYVGNDVKGVLIDDYDLNLFAWNGVGVKIFNGINGSEKRWKGESIHYLEKPQEIANTIKTIALQYDLSRYQENTLDNLNEKVHHKDLTKFQMNYINNLSMIHNHQSKKMDINM